MKKLTTFSIVVSMLFTGFVAAKPDNGAQLKHKAKQAKIYRQHENNWRQPSYAKNVKLFKCYDSWGYKLRGKFTKKQQYFIELGGGSCQRVKHSRIEYGALHNLRYYDLPRSNVIGAAEEIAYQFGLHNAKLVQADDIRRDRRIFKYTLKFKTGRHGYREFRIKQNRHDGTIRAVYEV